MKPHLKLAETKTPDGAALTLHEHDGSFCIRIGGLALMHSTATASELRLGELAAERLSAVAHARVLIGGLGLGFTLKRVLERARPDARVEVAELIPEVVDWNRTFMANLNGRLLDDPRVAVAVSDVWDVLARAGANNALRYDAILVDIDNGPKDMVQKSNIRLYQRRGIELIFSALNSGGRAAIWSASDDRAFVGRLAAAGLKVEVVRAGLHANARSASYAIFVADKPRSETSATRR
jgi:spermidine synthase